MPLNLTKVREAMGDRTVTEVAKAMGVRQSNLSRILSGRYPAIAITQIDKLAAALGVKATKLID